ncbi:MAG: DUF3102 domain-containing protein [Deltaproteobacteria bacterium]|nr:DUF3102 domain-containing protein [Deltaproteobacteria bacterium]
MTTELTQLFDLPKVAMQVRSEHEQVRALAVAATPHAVRAGELLLQAKEQLPHGDWLPWLQDHCELTERTAQAYMRLARTLPTLDEAKAQRVADLPLREALRAIAAPREQQPEGAPALDLPPVPPEMVPGEGEAVIGLSGNYRFIVYPSVEHPGFFFTVCMELFDGFDGCVIETSERPIRGDCLALLASIARFPMQGARYERTPAAPMTSERWRSVGWLAAA